MFCVQNRKEHYYIILIFFLNLGGNLNMALNIFLKEISITEYVEQIIVSSKNKSKNRK